jgi:hypothetical protein
VTWRFTLASTQATRRTRYTTRHIAPVFHANLISSNMVFHRGGPSPFGIFIPSEIDVDESKKLVLKDGFGSTKCEVAFRYLGVPGFPDFNVVTVEQSRVGPTIVRVLEPRLDSSLYPNRSLLICPFSSPSKGRLFMLQIRSCNIDEVVSDRRCPLDRSPHQR